MRPSLTYIGFGLETLVSAAPPNKQHNRVISCQVGPIDRMAWLDACVEMALLSDVFAGAYVYFHGCGR